MKIFTCAPLPPPHGGITNWYNIVAAEAEREGHTLININTSPGKSVAGRSLFYRVFVQSFRMLKQTRELDVLIRTNKDVKIAHIATSGSLATIRDILFLKLFKRKGIRTVYHLHFGRVPEIFAKKGIEYQLINRAMLLASDVITIDPKSYDLLSKRYNAERVHYIPNPVRKFSVEICEDSKNIIFLGHVLKTKGVEELLQAWEELSDKYPDWTLTIAGYCEDKYREYLEKHYSMKHVEMPGQVSHDKAMKLLAESAFLVLPSYTEGFPNVVIEAMMCGKAVVATDVGAISDILSENCGLVVQPKDKEALKESMEKFLSDCSLCSIMGCNGTQKAIRRFESKIVFKRYIELWELIGMRDV